MQGEGAEGAAGLVAQYRVTAEAIAIGLQGHGNIIIDDADKRVGRLGYALAMRGAIRFSAIVADTTTHDADQDADSIELAAFASALRDRCAAAGEIRLARRAETAARALRAGTVFANIKSIAR